MRRCAVRDCNSGHQLLLPPANWRTIFAVWTTQAHPPGVSRDAAVATHWQDVDAIEQQLLVPAAAFPAAATPAAPAADCRRCASRTLCVQVELLRRGILDAKQKLEAVRAALPIKKGVKQGPANGGGGWF